MMSLTKIKEYCAEAGYLTFRISNTIDFIEKF